MTLTTPLSHSHYGADTDENFNTFKYDVRARVAHLNRNVIIESKEIDNWGG